MADNLTGVYFVSQNHYKDSVRELKALSSTVLPHSEIRVVLPSDLSYSEDLVAALEDGSIFPQTLIPGSIRGSTGEGGLRIDSRGVVYTSTTDLLPNRLRRIFLQDPIKSDWTLIVQHGKFTISLARGLVGGNPSLLPVAMESYLAAVGIMSATPVLIDKISGYGFFEGEPFTPFSEMEGYTSIPHPWEGSYVVSTNVLTNVVEDLCINYEKCNLDPEGVMSDSRYLAILIGALIIQAGLTFQPLTSLKGAGVK